MKVAFTFNQTIPVRSDVDEVFVTGTFDSWSNSIKMIPNGEAGYVSLVSVHSKTGYKLMQKYMIYMIRLPMSSWT